MRRVLSPLFTSLLAAGCVFSCVLALPAFAQSDPADSDSTTVQPITLDVSPQYPAPYQTVTITPSSTVFDIDSSTLTVTVNGQPLYKGTGGEAIPVTVGGPGSVTTVHVVAVADGQSYTQDETFRPASVALVVEPVSTTHPFYEGEGLVTSQGEVRLIAVPDLRTSANTAIDPSSLVYTWKLGDQILESDSGIGKSVLDASAPQDYRDADVTLTVESQDQSIVAEAETDISPTDPFVRIYENDPLMGPLYDNALSDTATMDGSEDTYRGVPYYFSETPDLSWTINGVQSGTDQDITVRSSGDGQGSAELGFSANQSDDLLSASTLLSVLFGQKSSGGIFGL